MKRIIGLLIIVIPGTVFGQVAVSIENQVYPAGFIHIYPTALVNGLRLDYGVSDKVSVFVRGAYSVTDRKDWGVFENEKGRGVGLGLGYEQRTPFLSTNLFVGLSANFWFMQVDWQGWSFPNCLDVYTPEECALMDFIPIRTEGATNVIVFQPALNTSYLVKLGPAVFLKPSLSLGIEVNVKTRGNTVGQGLVLLSGLQLGVQL